MLGIMRKYKQSIVIKVVFGIIVLSFLGTIFLVWGKGDHALTPSSYAVKVDGTKITYEEFQRTYYRLRDIYAQIYGGSMPPEVEKQLNLKRQAIDTLVDATLARKAAKDMGISVSRDDVQKAIAAIPSFQKNGSFDFNQYLQVLSANRLTPKDFEESQKEELLVRKAREKVKARAQVTDDEALKLFRKKNDTVDLLVATVSPDDVKGEIRLTDQELTDYLAKNAGEFKSPEKIALAYVHVDPAQWSGKVSVSEEEIQSWYQKHIDRYQGKSGILPLAEVKERVTEEARRFKAGQQAYETAAEAINRNRATGDLAAVAKALGAKVEETTAFTAQQPAPALAGDPEVVKRAFLLKQNELSGPVETPKGIYVLKLKERQPAEVPPLVQIRARVEEKAKVAKAVELAKKRSGEIQARLAKGETTGLKLQQTGSFAFDPKGNVPNVGPSAELMEAAFTLTDKAPAPPAPLQVGSRWVAFRLKQRTERNAAAFAAEKEKIKQQILPQKQEEEIQKWLKELRAKAKIEINPALQKD